VYLTSKDKKVKATMMTKKRSNKNDCVKHRNVVYVVTSAQRFHDNALYKLTSYLLTYLQKI